MNDSIKIPSTVIQRSFVPLVIVLGLLLSACSKPSTVREGILRLSDPESIASVVSDHLEQLPDSSAGQSGSEPFVDLYSRSSWHAFLVQIETNPGWVFQDISIPDAPRSPDGKSLLIEGGRGIAHVVPVRSESRIILECEGSFGFHERLTAMVVPLSAHVDLPVDNQPGALRRCFGSFGQKIIYCRFTGKEDPHRTMIVTNAETRALLFIAVALEEPGGCLERVRMSYADDRDRAGAPKESGESARIRATIASPYLGGVIRPSLLIPPRTVITFKRIRIAEGATFLCHVGATSGSCALAGVVMEGKEEDGTVHEIFRWMPDGNPEGWHRIETDLSLLSGRTVELKVTSDWRDEESERSFDLQLLCLGAPRILSAAGEKAERTPNLVLISLDTLRYDHLGCYGYSREVSPNMDRLAREGLLFLRAYSHAPYTLPSHASLLTSLFPPVHGAEYTEKGMIPDRAHLLGELLARRGLVTASFNGGGFVSHEFGFHRGFDLYCEVDPLGLRYLTGRPLNLRRLADGARGSLSMAFEWIETMRNRPFFLFLHTFMVHDYLPPPRLAAAFCGDHGGGPEKIFETVEAIRRKENDKQRLTPAEVEYLRNLYDACILAADEMIGELVAHLEEVGILDRTLIVVTSDHGEEFMDHDGMFHARTVYEEMIRIPLLMTGPSVPRGGEIRRTASHVDVMPTMLELMGVEFDRDALQGLSLAPYLAGEDWPGDRPVFAGLNSPGNALRSCVINEEWKYIEGDVNPALNYPAPAGKEVYRLTADPKERRDLWLSEPRAGRALEGLMQKMRGDFRRMRERLEITDRMTRGLSPELKELLRQQGYF